MSSAQGQSYPVYVDNPLPSYSATLPLNVPISKKKFIKIVTIKLETRKCECHEEREERVSASESLMLSQPI